MRHAKDPEHGSLLSRLRQTWNDFDTLSTRFIDINYPLSPVHEEIANVQEEKNAMCPSACKGNNTRHCNNWLSIKNCLVESKENVPRLCRVVFNTTTRGKIPHKSELE